jgi:pimeloyl-ACP methyl ester carboxylesterase
MTEPPFLSLADADEIFSVATAPGVRLPVYRLAGPPGAPALLFGHANGFAAGSYGPWLKELAGAATVFAFDARGHGGATWPEGPVDEVFAVDRLAEDLAAVSVAVAARAAGMPLFYVGHSLGGAAALRLAVRGEAPAWAAVALCEPPIFPAPTAKVHAEATEKQAIIIGLAERRRADWTSPEALYERLRGRGIFGGFDDALLRAHCRATLRPLAAGGCTLCCPPDVETAIYRGTRDADTWSRLGQVAMPIDLVSGDPANPERDWVSGAMAEIAEELPRARLAVVPGTGHMMIFEEPAACRDLLLRWLSSRFPGGSEGHA